jgi:uncharacterized protein
MEISLDKVASEPSELVLTATGSELDIQLDLAALTSPVVYRLSLWRIEDEIFLDGAVGYTIQYTCARCLKEYTKSYELPLNLVLQLVPDEQLKPLEDDDDQFVQVSAAATVYVLDQHLRDMIVLEVPLKPVCRETCRGLCPRCGANLNDEQCSCGEKTPDPRWDALRKLSGK